MTPIHQLDTELTNKNHFPLLTEYPRFIGILSPLNNSVIDVVLPIRW